MTIEEIKLYLEVCSHIIVILSVPIALYSFLRAKKREKEEREIRSYQIANEKYSRYLDLCIEYPDLDIFNYSDTLLRKSGFGERKSELIAFCHIISMFERVFLIYRERKDSEGRSLWLSWSGMADAYARKENFCKAWKLIGDDWDQDFQKWMNEAVQRAESCSSNSAEGTSEQSI